MRKRSGAKRKEKIVRHLTSNQKLIHNLQLHYGVFFFFCQNVYNINILNLNYIYLQFTRTVNCLLRQRTSLGFSL